MFSVTLIDEIVKRKTHILFSYLGIQGCTACIKRELFDLKLDKIDNSGFF